jgi:hypothetical protein
MAEFNAKLEAGRLAAAAENQDGATFSNIMGEAGSCHWKELIDEANRILRQGTGGHPAADFTLRTEDLIDQITGKETVTVRKVANNAPNSPYEPPALAIVEDTTCKDQDKALDISTAAQSAIAAANLGDGIGAAHAIANVGPRIPELIKQVNLILSGNSPSGWAALDYRLGIQGFLDQPKHEAMDIVLKGEQKDKFATVHYVNPHVLAAVRHRTDGQK